MRFEWDEAKNRVNQAKHDGLDFETAARVFNDPQLILAGDRIVEGEQGWHAIRAVSDALLLVVHTFREEDDGEEIIRIISAREANQRQCRIYIQQAAE
jgi:uncharacterized protein